MPPTILIKLETTKRKLLSRRVAFLKDTRNTNIYHIDNRCKQRHQRAQRCQGTNNKYFFTNVTIKVESNLFQRSIQTRMQNNQQESIRSIPSRNVYNFSKSYHSPHDPRESCVPLNIKFNLTLIWRKPKSRVINRALESLREIYKYLAIKKLVTELKEPSKLKEFVALIPIKNLSQS